jgi:hypothetical protein
MYSKLWSIYRLLHLFIYTNTLYDIHILLNRVDFNLYRKVSANYRNLFNLINQNTEKPQGNACTGVFIKKNHFTQTAKMAQIIRRKVWSVRSTKMFGTKLTSQMNSFKLCHLKNFCYGQGKRCTCESEKMTLFQALSSSVIAIHACLHI